MPDFRVAETAPEHPKLRAAGLAAAGLWSLAGAYSMGQAQLTDGWVPEYWVQSWPNGKRSAVRLVEVGLWTHEKRHGTPGFRFHDWFDVQRSSSQIEEEREASRARARKSRQKSGARSTERAAHVTRESHDSLSLSLTQTPYRDFGGEGPDLDARAGANGPPAPKLDPSNPRCPRHRDLPAGELGPPCRACRDARLAVESAAAAGPARDVDAEQARRVCSWCDADGWRIDPRNPHRGPLIPGARCDHTPWSDEQLEAAS